MYVFLNWLEIDIFYEASLSSCEGGGGTHSLVANQKVVANRMRVVVHIPLVANQWVVILVLNQWVLANQWVVILVLSHLRVGMMMLSHLEVAINLYIIFIQLLIC